MKLLVDTNVLVSGTLWDGPSARLLGVMETGRFQLVLSAELLLEFAEVVSRDKFAQRLSARQVTPRGLVHQLAREAELIVPVSLALPPELRDPKDSVVLAAALAGKVDAIVTGDDDLLSLGSFRGIPIFKVRDALQMLGISAE